MNQSASESNALFWCEVKQPEFQANAAIKAFIKEAGKGCTGEIFNYPLKSITPQFDYFDYRNNRYEDTTKILQPEKLSQQEEYTSIIPCFHESDLNHWHKAVFELLSQIQEMKGTFYYEIIKNKSEARIQFCVPQKNTKIFEDALKSKFPNTGLRIKNECSLLQEASQSKKYFSLIAYYPSLPYHRNLYSPQLTGTNPLYTLLQSLTNLEENELFYYRAAIEPSKNQWERNCLNLNTYEKKILDFYPEMNCGTTWFIPPSTESKKAINDKIEPEQMPFYFVQPLIAFFGGKEKLDSITSFMNSYRFGGQPYNKITEKRFIAEIGLEKTIRFLLNRTSHLHGHLLNRQETSSFILIPDEKCIDNKSFRLMTAKGSIIPKELQSNGVIIGEQEFFEEKTSLCLPTKYLEHSFALIGNQGFGKTNELLNMLSQIAQNPECSIIIFYFHDFEFVADFISTLPENRLDKVIVAMPNLQGKVLGRNLVDGTGVTNPSKKASFLAYALENASAALQIDVKFLIKGMLYCLIMSEDSAFDHSLNIIRNNDPIGRAKRDEVRKKTDNKLVLEFIDYIEHTSESMKKIFNKLQEFFDESNISEMCAYTGRDLFNYKDVVENHKILIWYLGGLGPSGNAIASFEVSSLHQHFLEYGTEISRPHHPTIIAIDEAQRIKAQGVVDSIREDRKHGLSYILSTQTIQGLDQSLKEAIDLISSSAYFQCTDTDAKYFSQKTGGIVSTKDIMALDKYEIFARIMSSQNVFRCKTKKFQPGDKNKLDFVIQNCLKKYYVDPEEQRELRKQQEKRLLSQKLPEKQNIQQIIGMKKTVKNKLENLPDSLKKIMKQE